MTNIFPEVQNEVSTTAAYRTYAFSNSHKYGFVCINLTFESVCHVSFDSADAFKDMLGTDDDFSRLEQLSIGETETVNGEVWTRVW